MRSGTVDAVRRGAAAIVVANLVAFGFASSDAFADAGAGEDVEALLKDLQQEYTALSTQDCAIACKAYASIRRAADRICGLEPGPRCSDARAKADDAQRRVQAACPDCHLAAAKPKDDERRAVEYAPNAPMGKASAGSADEKNAPSKGGCASCTTARSDFRSGLEAVGAAALAFSIRAIRRRNRRGVDRSTPRSE